MIKLVGTEKQVAWAEKIRKEKIEKLMNKLKILDDYVDSSIFK